MIYQLIEDFLKKKIELVNDDLGNDLVPLIENEVLFDFEDAPASKLNNYYMIKMDNIADTGDASFKRFTATAIIEMNLSLYKNKDNYKNVVDRYCLNLMRKIIQDQIPDSYIPYSNSTISTGLELFSIDSITARNMNNINKKEYVQPEIAVTFSYKDNLGEEGVQTEE